MDSGEWDPSGRYNELRWQWRILVLDLLLAVAARTGVSEDVMTEMLDRSDRLRRRLGLT